MQNTNNNIIKKHSKKIKQTKQVIVEEFNKNCQALLYYENDKIKKSKVFQLSNIPSLRKKILKQINKEYRLWIKVLWIENHLEEDDVQLLKYLDI